MRLIAILLFASLAAACAQVRSALPLSRSHKSNSQAAVQTAAWLDPDAKISTAVRLTSPAGIDVRQAFYWQPAASSGKPQPPLQVLLRTRDYDKREEGPPDPQRIATLDLLTGETAKLDEGITGLPIELQVAPDHTKAVVALLESLGDKKGYSLQAVDLRAYGYDAKPQELRPQPSVVPWQVVDNGDVLSRIVRTVVVDKGLPAIGYDWSSGTQLCRVEGKSFSTTDEPALAGAGKLRTGYTVSYDPALPDKARITYWLGDGGRGTKRWEQAYFGQSAPFDWRPPLRWLASNEVATVMFLPRALGGQSGLFRIVALESNGDARLIEDRATPDVSLVTAPDVLLYAMRGGSASWSVWASSADGLRKQRVWAADNTVFLEVLDIASGRRVLVHRQYFGGDNQLHSDLLEISLDPLQQTKGKAKSDEEIAPLPSAKAVIEEEKSAPKKQPKSPSPEPPDDLFPTDPGGGGFIPDNPGGGPPPISGD